MPGKIDSDPDASTTAFLFRLCVVEESGGLLTVTVPRDGLSWRGATVAADGSVGWTAPAPLDASAINVRCAKGGPQRSDRSEYPPSPRYADPARFGFAGAFRFGRLIDGTAAALIVDGSVVAIEGLPAGVSWSGFHSIEVSCSPPPAGQAQPSASALAAAPTVSSSTTGPHLPYP